MMNDNDMNEKELTDLMGWSAKQGNILTGGGILASRMIEGTHYSQEDLAHYHLLRNTSWEYFREWSTRNRRSSDLIGAWSRPIFAGGWDESGDIDTSAFNLQTPSIFIDMRFPNARPKSFVKKRGFADFTMLELRMLARQHCFAGYTLPDENNPSIFTRHHIIDWNFHPSFPRARPNKWKVQIKSDKSSFKEFSVATDEDNIPVYFERWSRIPNDSEGFKYFAARRLSSRYSSLLSGTDQSNRMRDAVLVIVGNHFALAQDRAKPFPLFRGSSGPGGPALVDYAAELQDRASIEEYLQLQGSYGTISNLDNNKKWIIQKSTYPWLEGSVLLRPGDVSFTLVNGSVRRDRGSSYVPPFEYMKMFWGNEEWLIFECSFSFYELQSLFDSTVRSRL
jgi:hypothetical protein